MARGFESKMVEFQQEEAQRRVSKPAALSPEEKARAAERESLELARKRVAADLEHATAPAHRQMLAALDERLRSV
jgi:hypothetical protein